MSSNAIARRLESIHAFDRAVAEFLRMLGELLLQRIGEKGRHLGAAGGNGAEGKADKVLSRAFNMHKNALEGFFF